MRYRIVNESVHRIRIRLYTGSLSAREAGVLEYAFSHIRGVRKVTVYAATGGIALEYDGDRGELLEKLAAFQYKNVEMMAGDPQEVITAQEMRDRKLDPALKKKLRGRILVETVADLVMPVPLQVGYHVYQMITLRDI